MLRFMERVKTMVSVGSGSRIVLFRIDVEIPDRVAQMLHVWCHSCQSQLITSESRSHSPSWLLFSSSSSRPIARDIPNSSGLGRRLVKFVEMSLIKGSLVRGLARVMDGPDDEGGEKV